MLQLRQKTIEVHRRHCRTVACWALHVVCSTGLLPPQAEGVTGNIRLAHAANVGWRHPFVSRSVVPQKSSSKEMVWPMPSFVRPDMTPAFW